MTFGLTSTYLQLTALARKHNLFLMEALWSRFLPSYDFVMNTIRNGIIGDVHHVNVTFGIAASVVPRLTMKRNGGGTVLDIGIYTLNIIEMVFDGEQPTRY